MALWKRKRTKLRMNTSRIGLLIVQRLPGYLNFIFFYFIFLVVVFYANALGTVCIHIYD